jgi:hypothetical protein
MQTSWKDAATGACIQIGIGYPFELLKTRSQLSSLPVTADARRLFRRHGVRGFYHGAAIPFVLTMGSFHSTFFMMNTIESRLLPPDDPDVQVYSSSIAGILSACVLNPFEVIKCHRQGRISLAWTDMIRERHLFRGLVPHVLREGVGFSSYFGSYLWLYRRSEGHADSAHWRRFACGAAAGVVSTMCAFPLDIWKTRSQVLTDSSCTRFPWSGLGVVIVRSFFVNGILFLVIGKD